jgi:hypothetical protein
MHHAGSRTPSLRGGVVPGGLAYAIGELDAVSPAATSTGLEQLDAATGGGLLPGAVWTVIGPSRVGVTEFAVRIACAASCSGTVILANGHVATHLIVKRTTEEAAITGSLAEVTSRVSIASWLPLPRTSSDGTYSWDSACAAADVVVMDTLDEMLRPAAWPTADELVLALRGLRESARHHGTAVLLTARTGQEEGDAPVATEWSVRQARRAFEDVGDVQIRLGAGPPGFLALGTYVRGLGHDDVMIETSTRRRSRR